MHTSAKIKAELFVKHYLQHLPRQDGQVRVLEVGSKSYLDQDTLRYLFTDAPFHYTGLDIEAGKNVDLVPADTFIWDELANESFDLVISSQTFEHNPYFWVTFAEMARVVSSNGLLLITAPGGGRVHRFPFDCWRFYPDSWQMLCDMAGIELLESHFENDSTAHIVPGGTWRDSSLIARKGEMKGPAAASFYDRLKSICAPFRGLKLAEAKPDRSLGPCFAAYEQLVRQQYTPSMGKNLERALRRYSPPRITD